MDLNYYTRKVLGAYHYRRHSYKWDLTINKIQKMGVYKSPHGSESVFAAHLFQPQLLQIRRLLAPEMAAKSRMNSILRRARIGSRR